MNAREGIKTRPLSSPRPIRPALKTMNAREGIKTAKNFRGTVHLPER